MHNKQLQLLGRRDAHALERGLRVVRGEAQHRAEGLRVGRRDRVEEVDHALAVRSDRDAPRPRNVTPDSPGSVPSMDPESHYEMLKYNN